MKKGCDRVRISFNDGLLTLRYSIEEKDRYVQDKEENDDIIDNTIDFDDEFVINILLRTLRGKSYRGVIE